MAGEQPAHITTSERMVKIVYDDARLLSRQCSVCGGQEFRRVLSPDTSFSLLTAVTPCPSCKVNLEEYNYDRQLAHSLDGHYGLAICLGCNRLVALI
jgi:hypothetical protein